jgi:hypothetical protein
MDLTGYSIYDIYGVNRIELKGVYTAESLARKLISEWIPYLECYKCGREDYCKYRAEGRADIRCGVIVTAVTNFIRHTFALLDGMNAEQIQSYLDGMFHLEQFLFDTEQTTGMFIDDAMIEWWGKYKHSLFGRTTHLREHLIQASKHFRKIQAFESEKGILFVEGWSEKVFLDKLRETHSSWFLHLKIEVYEGRGNRQPKRIQMLLDRYIDEGYIVYIQGDADGKDTEIFRTLVSREAVQTEHTFVFRHDFETAIPVRLLYLALRNLGELENVSREDFETLLATKDRSHIKTIREEYGLDLEPLKLLLADAVAGLLNKPLFGWWQNEEFMDSELGNFLKFIMDVK